MIILEALPSCIGITLFFIGATLWIILIAHLIVAITNPIIEKFTNKW
jgi:hypothetical protein